jgi:hypothetical protein
MALTSAHLPVTAAPAAGAQPRRGSRWPRADREAGRWPRFVNALVTNTTAPTVPMRPTRKRRVQRALVRPARVLDRQRGLPAPSERQTCARATLSLRGLTFDQRHASGAATRLARPSVSDAATVVAIETDGRGLQGITVADE